MAKGESDSAEEFSKFLSRIESGAHLTNRDIVRFSALFDDKFTLDKLSREQVRGIAS